MYTWAYVNHNHERYQMANKQTEEPKAHKNINLNKLKKHVYKFSAAVTLTVASYSAFYSLIVGHTTNTPKAVAEGLSVIITVALIIVVAQCDK